MRSLELLEEEWCDPVQELFIYKLSSSLPVRERVRTLIAINNLTAASWGSLSLRT